MATPPPLQLPESLQKGMNNYLTYGLAPGSFLRAVLENDLMAAVGYADPDNEKQLRAIVQYVRYEIPGDCHGSKEAVAAWIKKWEALRA